jgi:small-conductance mechanosensitive channel
VPGVLTEPAPYVTIKEFGPQYIEYEVFFLIDVTTNERGFIGTRNDVKIQCWRALRDAGMTFSTDVTSGIAIQSASELNVNIGNREADAR